MPGLGNAMGMLYNSYRTRTPLVVYAGQHPQRGNSQEPILAGDLVRLAEPLTKWAVEAQDANEIPVLLRRAFKIAMEPPRGPVFLSVPTNVMDEEADAEITPRHLRRHARPARPRRRRAHRLAAGRRPLARHHLRRRRLRSRRPGGAGPARGDCWARASTPRSRPSCPSPPRHPLYAGLLNVVSAAALKGQLSTADVVLAVGTPVFTAALPDRRLALRAGCTQVIHIDLDAREIGKNWPVEVGLLADPRLAMADIVAQLKANDDGGAAGRSPESARRPSRRWPAR